MSSDEMIGYFAKSDLFESADRDWGRKADAFVPDIKMPALDELRFGSRSKLEESDELVQLIPVAMLVTHDFKSTLVVRKGGASASAAERGRDLVWTGGHASEGDLAPSCGSVSDFAKKVLEREIAEELGVQIDLSGAEEPYFIYDPAGKSGRHLAMCFVVPADLHGMEFKIDPEELVKPRKNSKSGKVVELQSLLGSGDYKLDSWSSVMVCRFFERDKHEDALRRVRLIDFGSEENRCIDGRYVLCEGDDCGCQVLGSGGSSIVLRADQRLGTGPDASTIPRAIKFFLFGIKQARSLKTDIAGDNYRNEMANIVSLNHQNVLKVIDGGTCGHAKARGKDADDKTGIPYMVTELVEGENLGSLIECDIGKPVDAARLLGVLVDEETVFAFINEIISAVDYLHSRSFYHCDIAPKNIFLQEYSEGRYHVVLGDLGAGVKLGEAERRDDTTKALVIGTGKYMTRDAAKRDGQAITLKEFGELQPRWDVHATVLTLREFVAAALEVFKRHRLPARSLEVLAEYLDSLRTDEPDAEPMGIEELKAKVDWLGPDQASIAKVPELSEASWQTTSKLLPLYSYVISRRFEKLRDHSAFKRLRNVPQLLMGSTVFPGANHTRFEHSLGTYEMMRKLLRLAISDKRCAVLLDRRSIEMALVGALMMSVTRFPFSYVIHEIKHQGMSNERLFPALTRRELFKRVLKCESSDEDAKREDRTLYDIIETHFPLVTNHYPLEGNGVVEADLEDLFAVVCGPSDGRDVPPQLQFVYSLLHSTIDARVLDFLARDAYHMGDADIPDFTELLEHLTVHNNRVAVKRSGQSAAERVVIQRYWMFKNYYWNQPSRLFTAVATWVLCELYLELKDHSETLEDAIMSRFLDNKSADTIKKMLVAKAEECKRPDVKAAIERDLDVDKGRPGYKRLAIFSPTDADATIGIFCASYLASDYAMKKAVREKIEAAVVKASGITPDDVFRGAPHGPVVLIDMPCGDEDKLGSELNVILDEDKDEVMSLEERSPVVSSIIANFDKQLRSLRVFIDAKFLKQSQGRRDVMRQSVRECLVSIRFD